MEYTEGETDSEEDQVHQQLLNDVASVTKRSYVDQRTEGAVIASEYHLAPLHQDGKVSMEGLLSGLVGAGKKSLLALKKRLTSVEERSSPLAPPLNKIQADRVNRKAANQETCKEVGKWAPIVKRNREAEHLSFPLQRDCIPPPSLSTKLESFMPCTELEQEVATILAASDNMEIEGQELTEAEKKSLFQMTVEEAMDRKKSLQKHRALVSYYEQKCRRIRRIKSKKFHRVQRKRLEKLGNKPEVTEEELIKLRAKERMTLKHSNKAKWAKKQRAREHRDPSTQQALSEHHQKKNELKQKIPDREDTEESGSGESEHEDVSPGVRDNPWLAYPASKPLQSFKATGKSSSSLMTKLSLASPKKSEKVVLFAPNGDHIDTASSFIVNNAKDTGRRGGFGIASEQLLAVREAFSGDNVVEEFEREKAELEAKDAMEDVPVVMPGWGSWGGEGVRPPRKKTRIPKERPPRKPRLDAGMNHVIIYEGQKNKKVAQHMVQSVPWPYTSKEQFDKTHSTPVGRHWNTEATFQQMIKPRVNVDIGEIIEPLVLTEDVRNYITRSEVRKEKKQKKRS